MSAQLNEAIVDRVDQLGFTAWSGVAFRNTTVGRDPLSGAGARANGGRWNPRDEFPVIYLAIPEASCIGELDRASEAAGISPKDRIAVGLELHTIELRDIQVLDLRSTDALAHVGLTSDDISDPDWTACQTVGHAAWFLHAGGILAPSATGIGNVLAAFELRVQPGTIQHRETIPLTEELYDATRKP